MKITTINFVQESTLPKREPANTQMQGNVRQILENLGKAKAGQALVIMGDDLKKFERYALQKKLQKAGAHVTVGIYTNPENGKQGLSVRKMSDAEWKDYIAAAPRGPAPKK